MSKPNVKPLTSSKTDKSQKGVSTPKNKSKSNATSQKTKQNGTKTQPKDVNPKTKPKTTTNVPKKTNTTANSSRSTKPKASNSPFKRPDLISGICEEMALINLHEIDTLLRIDAPILSSDKRFHNANKYSYYLLANTWLFQVKEATGIAYLDFKEALLMYGVVHVIRTCAQAADAAIRKGIDRPEDFWFDGYQGNLVPWLYPVFSGCADLKQLLQILRYAKRFCPSYANLVEDVGVTAFTDSNRRCRDINSLCNAETSVTRMSRRLRPYLQAMLKGFTLDVDRGFFSNGTAFDAKRQLVFKLTAFAESNPCILDVLYPLVQFQNFTQPAMSKSCCKLACVPKSYKTPRVIAFEPVERQFLMQAARLEIEDRLVSNKFDRYLTLHDQGGNRELCMQGSLLENYATIDLSSASDSLSRALVWRAFPSNVFNDIYDFLSKYVVMPTGERRIVHMFSTSGSALTFVVESMIFLAISLLANDIYKSYTGCQPLPPHIFGDDMVVDIRTFDTVEGILLDLGFIMNRSKSFGSGSHFRESCGVEYTFGLDTTTKYFPRSELVWDHAGIATTLSSIISLQHKLFCYNDCRYFLAKFVRAIEPRMTSHAPGTDCADLWEASPVYNVKKAPMGAKLRQQYSLDTAPPYMLREEHLTIVSEYSKAKPGSTDRSADLEMYHYRSFLKSGPRFEDGLMELLRVSERPWCLDSDFNEPRQVWRYIKE